MHLPNTRKYPILLQYFLSISLVLVIASILFYAEPYIGYRVVALVLLMTVSVIAMLFDIMPVLLSAICSAVIWNFLFIPPIFTFHIHTAEDVLMFLMYFLIACVHAVLMFKIKEEEKKARDKEEQKNTIKLYDTLLHSLSHELRTPIATIIGSVDMLKENKAKLSEENQADLLTEINIAGLRLNRQVENLLSMSRLESGMLKLTIDWCDMNDLIHSVIQKLPWPKTHILDFIQNDTLPYFKLDSGIIEQIIHNILHNAIQYTPIHTTIRIQLNAMSTGLQMEISDNGIGFPPQTLPFVFDKFYRLPHAKSGGSGLGLSIAKGFLEAHQGKIWLENNEQGGASFYIEIQAETSFLNNLKND